MNQNVELAKSVFLNVDKTNMNQKDVIKGLLTKLRDKRIFFMTVPKSKGYMKETFKSIPEALKIMVSFGCKFYDYKKFIPERDSISGEFIWSSEVYYEKLIGDGLDNLGFFDIADYYNSRMFMSSQYMAVFYEWALGCGGNLFLIQMDRRVPYKRPNLDSSMTIIEIVEIYKKILENSGVTIKISTKNTLISNSKSFNYDDLMKASAFHYMLNGFQMNLSTVKQTELTDKIQDWLGTLTPPNEIAIDGAPMSSILNVTAQLANTVRDLEVVKQQIIEAPPVIQPPIISEPNLPQKTIQEQTSRVEENVEASSLASQLALASKKSDLENSVASLTSQLAVINPSVVSDPTFETFIGAITTVLKKIDEINFKLKQNPNQDSTSLKSERDLYRQEASDMIAKLSGTINYDSTSNTIKDQINELKSKLEVEKSKSISLSNQLASSNEYSEKKQKESQEKINQLTLELEKKNSQLLAVNSLGGQVGVSNADLDKKYNEVIKQKDALDIELKASKSKITDLNQEILNLNKKLKDLQTSFESPINLNLSASIENSADFEKNKQAIILEINKYKYQLTKAEKNYEDLKLELASKNREIDKYKNEITAKNEFIKALGVEKSEMTALLSKIGYNNLGKGYSLPPNFFIDNQTANSLLAKLYFASTMYPTLNMQSQYEFFRGIITFPIKEQFKSFVNWTGEYKPDTFYYNEMKLLCSEAGEDVNKIARTVEIITGELNQIITAFFGDNNIRGYVSNNYSGPDKYLTWNMGSGDAPILIKDHFIYRTKREFLGSGRSVNEIFPSIIIDGKTVNILTVIDLWTKQNPKFKEDPLFKNKIPPLSGLFKNQSLVTPEIELIINYMWDHHDKAYVHIEMYNNYFISLWNLRKGMCSKLMDLYKPEIPIQSLTPDFSNIRIALSGFMWIPNLINELKQIQSYTSKIKLEAEKINNELKIAAEMQKKQQEQIYAKNPYKSTTAKFKNVIIGENHPTITQDIMSALIELDKNLIIFSTLNLKFGNIRTIRALTPEVEAAKKFMGRFYTPKLMDNRMNMILVYNDEINAGKAGLNYFDENKFMNFFIDALSRNKVCFSLVIPPHSEELARSLHEKIIKYNPKVNYDTFNKEFKTKGLYMGKYVTNTNSAFEFLDSMIGFYFYDETAWIQMAKTNPEKYTVTEDSSYEWGNHLTSFHYMHLEVLRLMFKPALGLDILTNYDAWINTQQIRYDQFAIAYYMKLFARDFRWVAISPIGDMTYPIFARPASKTVMIEDMITQFHIKTMKYMGVYIASRNTWEIDTSDSLEVFINPLEQLYSILYYIDSEKRTHPFFSSIKEQLNVDHFYYGCIRATAPFRRLKMSWWTNDITDCGYDNSPYTPISREDYLIIMEKWDTISEQEKEKYRETNKLAQLLGRSSKYLDVVREILKGATKITVKFPWNPLYMQMGLVGLLPLLLPQTTDVGSDNIVNIIKESDNTHMCLFSPEVSYAFTNFLDDYAGEYAELFLYSIAIVGTAPLCNGTLCDCLDRGGLMAMGSKQGDSTNRCNQGVKAYCYIPKYRTLEFENQMKEYSKICKDVIVQTSLHSLEMQKKVADLAKEAVTIGLKAIAA